MKYCFYSLIALLSLTFAQSIQAGAFFETGQATLTDTIDNGSWVTVTTQKTYINPVVIAGPISHNNDNSLSVRVRNAAGNSFQIGMQSPCESNDADPAPAPAPQTPAITCPSSWSAETVSWLVVEKGTWVFPDGTKIEAYLHDTSIVRSGWNTQNNIANINYSHNYSVAPAVLHTVNSFNDSRWISSTVWSPSNSKSVPPSTAAFRLTLEGAEVAAVHALETIGWVAIERGSGTNNSQVYAAGRTGGLDVDRHSDECQNLSYGASFSTNPNLLAKHNTMSGGNGAWVRLCNAEIGTSSFNVHVDEDQVRDTERTGIPEYVSWFAFDSGAVGALEFLTATKTFTDADADNQVGPGELVTFNITITNLQDDFVQANNPSDEFVDVLDANLVPEPSSLTASSGTISASGQTVTWNGSVAASGTVTLSYQARVADNAAVCSLTNIANQAELRMDPIDNSIQTGDIDNLNNIVELSDDPAADDGADSDMDSLTNDDDLTLVPVACLSDIEVSKIDPNTNYIPGSNTSYTITITNNGPHNLIGANIVDNLPANVSSNGNWSCDPALPPGDNSASCITGSAAGTTQAGSGNINLTVDIPSGKSLVITLPVSYSATP
ncbi:hypothetical protein [Kangiella sp. TOML190]|uniref:DUF7927 domain-containing protein n=1 Tax=Kangiella sp. TOML190 TaxID=2931351 RepID=UPI002041B9D3|nr:hypothetical protein [Kangiella sp. TOML190]